MESETQQQRLDHNNTKKYNTDECAICQEKYGDNFYVLSCYHKFDSECFIKWNKKTCPICRADMSYDYNQIKKIYDKDVSVDNEFYNSYIPYSYGQNQNNSTDGIVMFNFVLYPENYQPSGHVNVSRAREFYVQFSQDTQPSDDNIYLETLTYALNFLLISDGSPVLRYTDND